MHMPCGYCRHFTQRPPAWQTAVNIPRAPAARLPGPRFFAMLYKKRALKLEGMFLDGTNRFIKLLLHKAGAEYLLIYGFSARTGREPMRWRCDTDHGRAVCRAIMSAAEAGAFEKALTEPGRISCGKISLPSPRLTPRMEVFSAGSLSGESGPLERCSRLRELWSLDKNSLFNEVLSSLDCGGEAARYRGARALFGWVREESGVDLLKDGHRLGNFESFEPLAMPDGFAVEVDNRRPLKTAEVKRLAPCPRPLIVNCLAEHCGRVIINRCKLLMPEEGSARFSAAEPMSRIAVQIWDAESSELVYRYDMTMVMSISLNGSLMEPGLGLSDPWTKKLRKSAPGMADEIRRSVESVSRAHSGVRSEIRSPALGEIDAAMRAGDTLTRPYRDGESRGAFVPGGGVGGEIDSFLKVKEYIDLGSVSKVIIADPYFSAESAIKLLSRIEHPEIRLEILSSLGGMDPDTGSSVEYEKIREGVRRFTAGNAAILHKNLRIRDLRRGNAQVFHDRFLIRRFKDGSADGFLMSNSLNSMGARQPFTMAPLGREVCLEVLDYLRGLCGDAQPGSKKPGQITCEVLYDSAAETPRPEPERGVLRESGWLSAYYGENGRLDIGETELEGAVAIILSHWGEDKGAACRALAELASEIICTLHGAFEKALRGNSLVPTGEIAAGLAEIARAREAGIGFADGGLNSDTFELRKLLKGEARPSVIGFRLLYDYAGHVCYPGGAWLSSGYRLMLSLDPEGFVKLLDEIRSPLMFDILAAAMLFSDFDEALYASASRAESVFVQLLGSRWLFSLAAGGRMDNGVIRGLLGSLEPGRRAVQLAYMLSSLSFRLRNGPEEGRERLEELKNWCLGRLGADMAACDESERTLAYAWLDESEICAKARLYRALARNIPDAELSREALEKAAAMLLRRLRDFSYEYDVSEQLELYLSCEEELGNADEKRLQYVIASRKTLEAAAEPCLEEYNYGKWHNAAIAAKRQRELLRLYAERHPEDSTASSAAGARRRGAE